MATSKLCNYSAESIFVFGLLSCCFAFVVAQNRDGLVPDSCRTPLGDEGSCKSIYSCKPLLDYITSLNEQKINNDVRKTVQAYKCGQDSRGPTVCCPSKSIAQPVVDKTKLLPDECGVAPNIDKIVNGMNASLFEFPWMAALLYSSRNGLDFQCGGALINKRYILTAAHCIKSNRQLVQVRLGEHDLSSEKDCDYHPLGTTCAPPVQNFDVTVDDAIVHPEYDTITLANDIALIRLRHVANLEAISVKPVCLPVKQNTKTNKFKSDLTVVGWGKTESGNASPYLLKVTVPVVENDVCMQLYKAPIQITDQQMCAGGKNSQNTCAGDSGGPLMLQLDLQGVLRTVQYGIVSAGPTLCEKKNFPVRYTRVTQYLDWILENINP